MAWIERRAVRAAVAAGCWGLMAGCTVMAPRDSPLPRDGLTMTEIYRQHMSSEGAQTPRDRLPLRAPDEDAPVLQRKILAEQMNNRFERLPNPDLTMHVFPHLAQGRYPVPGYDTVFPLYETVQYAMPGEVASRRRSDLDRTADVKPADVKRPAQTVGAAE